MSSDSGRQSMGLILKKTGLLQRRTLKNTEKTILLHQAHSLARKWPRPKDIKKDLYSLIGRDPFPSFSVFEPF